MAFWESGLVFDALIVAALLFVAATLRKIIPPMRALGVPDSMVAGFIGLVCGPTALALLPFDPETLASFVYHGLALVFIAVSLQSPAKGKGGGGATSVAFAIPFFAVLQGLVGLLAVLAFSAFVVEKMHPGMGLMLPLGFNQGPGQALSLGRSWEASGFASGGEIGLIVASMGFAWASSGSRTSPPSTASTTRTTASASPCATSTRSCRRRPRCCGRRGRTSC